MQVSKKSVGVLSALAIGAVGFAGCGSSDKKSDSSSSSSTSTPAKTTAKAGKVAVLLPDSKSSVRWETQDRKYLGAAFKAAGVDATITNAEGDPATQRNQADQAITNGAKVILLVDLDPGSGAAIIANAHKQGVKVIDYVRIDAPNGLAGKLQGQGLVNCLQGKSDPKIAELNGSPTDNNATLFADGYNSVLDPLYKSGKLTKVADQSVPDWDNQQALTIFEQMLQKTGNKIDGVLSANDGLANSVISALKSRKLPNIPVTGQDATAQGIQHILAGEQCMTVYKAVRAEADAASKLAIALAKGQTPTTNGTTDNKTAKTPSVLLKPVAVTKANIKDSSRKVPSVLLTPVSVTKENINDTVIKDGFLKRSDICQGTYAADCTKAGI